LQAYQLPRSQRPRKLKKEKKAIARNVARRWVLEQHVAGARSVMTTQQERQRTAQKMTKESRCQQDNRIPYVVAV
jgi:hypothetical protein